MKRPSRLAGLIANGGGVSAIAAGPGSAVNRKVFANRTLVWIGLISYPLYLWHWPILFVVRRLFLPGRKGLAAAAVILGAMAFSILLSSADLQTRRDADSFRKPEKQGGGSSPRRLWRC